MELSKKGSERTGQRSRPSVSPKKAGQSIIESMMVVLFACFLFLAVFQISQAFAAKSIMSHAAARGARSRSVGFNRFQVAKVIDLAAIPASGKRVQPPTAGQDLYLRQLISGKVGAVWDAALANTRTTGSGGIERSLLPIYMSCVNTERADYVLDYANWERLTRTITDGDRIRIDVSIGLPAVIGNDELLTGAFIDSGQRAGYAKGILTVHAQAEIEAHAPLYLEETGE